MRGDGTIYSQTGTSFPLRPEDCETLRGHCWIESETVVTLGVMAVYTRHCKHCGVKQKGHSQPAIVWKFDENKTA